ncbi:MAG: efflux RND transporter periplasmic adaptor subunit [Planctomycetota bacterium]|jgi:RND family efflux transporter MFP subunit|nr:efflux RND transporter periplasmic adaptor subunit [Planctomycetota bacterium]
MILDNRIGGVLILLTLLTGCDGTSYRRGRSSEESTQTSINSSAIPVRVTEAVLGTIGKSLEFSSTVQVRRVWEVHPAIAGNVVSIHIERGDVIKKDDLLVELADPDLQRRRNEQATLKDERAQGLEKANLQLQDIQSQIRAAQMDESDLAQQERTLEAQRRQAEKKYKDKKTLHIQELISDSEFGDIELERDKARNDYDGVKFRLNKTRLTLDRLRTIDQKRYQVELQMAKLDHSRQIRLLKEIDEDLKKMTVRAPASGIILQEDLRLGSRVSRDQKILTIAPISEFILRLRVPEQDARVLSSGMNARLHSNIMGATSPHSKAQSPEPINGTVDRVLPLVDEDSGTVEVLVNITQGTQRIRPGMLLRCEIEVEQREKSILVPRRAILYERDLPYLFVIDEDNKAHRQTVQLGFVQHQSVEILSGLKAGQRVVTVGQKTLRSGTLVQLIGG